MQSDDCPWLSLLLGADTSTKFEIKIGDGGSQCGREGPGGVLDLLVDSWILESTGDRFGYLIPSSGQGCRRLLDVIISRTTFISDLSVGVLEATTDAAKIAGC